MSRGAAEGRRQCSTAGRKRDQVGGAGALGEGLAGVAVRRGESAPHRGRGYKRGKSGKRGGGERQGWLFSGGRYAARVATAPSATLGLMLGLSPSQSGAEHGCGADITLLGCGGEKMLYGKRAGGMSVRHLCGLSRSPSALGPPAMESEQASGTSVGQGHPAGAILRSAAAPAAGNAGGRRRATSAAAARCAAAAAAAIHGDRYYWYY